MGVQLFGILLVGWITWTLEMYSMKIEDFSFGCKIVIDVVKCFSTFLIFAVFVLNQEILKMLSDKYYVLIIKWIFYKLWWNSDQVYVVEVSIKGIYFQSKKSSRSLTKALHWMAMKTLCCCTACASFHKAAGKNHKEFLIEKSLKRKSFFSLK